MRVGTQAPVTGGQGQLQSTVQSNTNTCQSTSHEDNNAGFPTGAHPRSRNEERARRGACEGYGKPTRSFGHATRQSNSLQGGRRVCSNMFGGSRFFNQAASALKNRRAQTRPKYRPTAGPNSPRCGCNCARCTQRRLHNAATARQKRPRDVHRGAGAGVAAEAVGDVQCRPGGVGVAHGDPEPRPRGASEGSTAEVTATVGGLRGDRLPTTLPLDVTH